MCKSYFILFAFLIPFLSRSQTPNFKCFGGPKITVPPRGLVAWSGPAPEGYVIVSAGWRNDPNSSNLLITENYPSDSTCKNWTFTFSNPSAFDTLSIQTYFICASLALTSVSESNFGLPERSSLGQNYPNPFNPVTNFEYTLDKRRNVRVDVFNDVGQLVSTLADGIMEAGDYQLSWNGKSSSGAIVSSGTYFYRLITDGVVQTKKMILIK